MKNKKKNVVLFLIIIIVAFVIISLLFFGNDEKKEKKNMNCQFNYDYRFADSVTEVHIVYTDSDIISTEYETKYTLTNQDLIDNIDLFEQELRKALDKSFSKKTKLTCTREENSFIVNYLIDNTNFNVDDIKASEYFGLNSENELIYTDLSKFISSIEELGGNCE